jgi:methylated-DNA-[protein]-cysteine S-methyltransferase
MGMPPDGDVVGYRYEVPGWGVGELVVRGRVLVAHRLPSRQRKPRPDRGGPQGGASAPEVTLPVNPSRLGDDFVPELCRRFAAHLRGERVAYDDVEVEEVGLADFQRSVLHAARAVGWGEVVSYGELAQRAGRPRAARAAGTFCARNGLALVVPCHRVVAVGRGEPYELGGYGPSGRRLKRRLLELEGTFL